MQTTRMAAQTLQVDRRRFVLGPRVAPHQPAAQTCPEGPRPTARFLAAYRAAIYRGPLAPGPWRSADPARRAMNGCSRWQQPMPTAPPFYLVTPARGPDPGIPGRSRHGSGCGAPCARRSMPAVLETDPAAARNAARAYLGPYLRTPAYQASWTEQGFDASDWEKPGSDRLVDAMVVWGDADALRVRIAEHVAAGVDHVAVIPIGPDGTTEHLPVLEALAKG